MVCIMLLEGVERSRKNGITTMYMRHDVAYLSKECMYIIDIGGRREGVEM